MSFGTNLQFMRKMHNGMTQEELAEKLELSRQTISKWEMDSAYPEMETAIRLCDLFNCSLDELFKEDVNSGSSAYSNMHVEKLGEFRYVRYAVISAEPEEDAQTHMERWAKANNITNPVFIGWNFPFVSQEQINVYHMHGYCSACILSGKQLPDCKEVITQQPVKYAVITIKDPFQAPFALIPNAYKTLFRYLEVNGLKHNQSKEILDCFEKIYETNTITYMDVYIAVI